MCQKKNQSLWTSYFYFSHILHLFSFVFSYLHSFSLLTLSFSLFWFFPSTLFSFWEVLPLSLFQLHSFQLFFLTVSFYASVYFSALVLVDRIDLEELRHLQNIYVGIYDFPLAESSHLSSSEV